MGKKIRRFTSYRTFMTTPTLETALRKAAQEENLNISEVIRFLLIDALERRTTHEQHK